jgi:uncharacterized protein (DUF1810 family)
MQSYNLDRYIKAQILDFSRAHAEIVEGKKRNDWMHFIFPCIKGTSTSFQSKIYEISCLREALLFYNHPILGDRYLKICQCLAQSILPIENLFNDADLEKLHASLTLFHIVDSNQHLFENLLNKHFKGLLHEPTIEQLEQQQQNVV